MEYYVKSVVPIIESNYDNFTTVEKNIADFFIQNRKKVDFSAKAVAENLFVSEASLSRFAKKCGYRGYREFVYQYEKTFVEKEESITGNTRMVLNAYQELLNKTYSLMDEAQVGRIARYLNKAERVFVCGIGSSGFAADEMEMRFMRIGVDINSVKARNRGEFDEFCDEVVLIPSLKHLNYGNVISPQFPILVMVDIIYSCYVEQDKYKKETFHDYTLRALEGVKSDDY